MKAVLQHPKKTLSEIAHDVHGETGCQYTLESKLFLLLKEKPFQSEKGLFSIFIARFVATLC